MTDKQKIKALEAKVKHLDETLEIQDKINHQMTTLMTSLRELVGENQSALRTLTTIAFNKGETIMISVNGNNRPNQKENVEKTKQAIDKAISQGVVAFIADNETVANSSHNSGGEGVIRNYLLSKGLLYKQFKGAGLYIVNRAAVSDETIDRHAASYKQMLEDIKSEPISEYKDLGGKQDIKGFKEFVNKEQNIKEGVSKLFEQNPELANGVYEALGFKTKDDNLDKITFEEIDSTTTHDYYTIQYEGKPIGKIDLNNYGYIDGIEIDSKYRNKGLGKSIYRKINTELLQDNLKSDSLNRISEDAKRVWESLIKSGEAIKTSEGYKFIQLQITQQQKQEAQRAYSQYLDTRQPDVILPIGTSGSGKSTFIKSLPQENLVVIEPDAMRVEFTGDMNDKSKDKEIYQEAAKRVVTAIKQGKQVVFDTTNLTKDKRLPFIEAIKKAIPTANIQYKLMELNPELAKQRIKAQLERIKNFEPTLKETPVNINAKFPKDQTKANYSDGIIAYGTHSTGNYANAFGGTRIAFTNGTALRHMENDDTECDH